MHVRLPQPERGPFSRIGRRLGVAIGLVVFVALVAYADRSGYRDAAGGEVGLLDSLYYATVSITTTGYGDITPVTDRARLLTTLLVTPARVLFLILLVGTTIELLAERTREAYQRRRWSARLNDHVIICGYGTKGRSAVNSILGHGVGSGEIVVIDPDRRAVERAEGSGLAALHGEGSDTDVLRAAHVERARAVVVAVDRDDAAVLVTLTAREINPAATIVSAVREEENAHLLEQSGADSVITSSGAAGRMLGLATQTPRLVAVIEDLLTVGEGLDVIELPVPADRAGTRMVDLDPQHLAVAVLRGDEIVRFDDPRSERLEPGDRVVCLASRDTAGR